MNAIEIKDLTKKFNGLVAVDAISLQIGEGELFGLLGPSGAGKTTTLSMLCTILEPTEGEAKINGFDVRQQDTVRNSIGVVFQDPSLDDELTGRENLEFHGRLYHLEKQEREKRMDEVLKLVGLEDKAGMQVKTYSGGMKRRLEIARGLMHRPRVLFLDEPTLGLDPQTRRGIWEYIEKLNKEQKITVILTTHFMEEADYLCGRIAIIDHGMIIALDTPEALKSMVGDELITLETEEAERLAFALGEEGKKVKAFGGKVNVTTARGEEEIPKVMALAEKEGIKINSVNLKKPSLEDVFIHYTGRTIREEEASPLDKLRTGMRTEWRRR